MAVLERRARCVEDRAAPENLVPPAVAGGDGAELGVSDCESLANLRRPSLKNEQRSALWSRRQSLLSAKCVGTRETKYVNNATGAQVSSCYSSDRSQQPSYSSGTGQGSSPTGAAPPANVAIEDSSQGATNYSTTNNQVAGVDEADFVKNDANHVYVLSNDGLHVIDAWPAAAAHEVAHLSLPGEPRRMFLYGKRLVVYTRMSSSGSSHANPSSQGCTYGYSCRFSSEGGQTLAIIYDVSDPAKPAEVTVTNSPVGYVASRRVGQRVYTVVNDTGVSSAPGVNLTLQADNPPTSKRPTRRSSRPRTARSTPCPLPTSCPGFASSMRLATSRVTSAPATRCPPDHRKE